MDTKDLGNMRQHRGIHSFVTSLTIALLVVGLTPTAASAALRDNYCSAGEFCQLHHNSLSQPVHDWAASTWDYYYSNDYWVADNPDTGADESARTVDGHVSRGNNRSSCGHKVYENSNHTGDNAWLPAYSTYDYDTIAYVHNNEPSSHKAFC